MRFQMPIISWGGNGAALIIWKKATVAWAQCVFQVDRDKPKPLLLWVTERPLLSAFIRDFLHMVHVSRKQEEQVWDKGLKDMTNSFQRS